MMKTLILDDEKPNVDWLALLVKKHCPQLEIVGECYSVEQAIEVVAREKPDLVFLDIAMPERDGFDFLRHYHSNIPFQVIFTTAHDEYAVQAFKYHAVHYLLKSVTEDELVEAVSRVQKIDTRIAINELSSMMDEPRERLFLPTPRNVLRMFDRKDIIYAAADGQWTDLYLKSERGKQRVTKLLGDIEFMLKGDPRFCRIHNSHIINLYEVNAYEGGNNNVLIMRNGEKLSIARTKKDLVLDALHQL